MKNPNKKQWDSKHNNSNNNKFQLYTVNCRASSVCMMSSQRSAWMFLMLTPSWRHLWTFVISNPSSQSSSEMPAPSGMHHLYIRYATVFTSSVYDSECNLVKILAHESQQVSFILRVPLGVKF